MRCHMVEERPKQSPSCVTPGTPACHLLCHRSFQNQELCQVHNGQPCNGCEEQRVDAFSATRNHIHACATNWMTSICCARKRRRARRLVLVHAAEDVCRRPNEALHAPPEWHSWVKETRGRLGIDEAVGEWCDKPLLYHLKARPHRFLRCMIAMSSDLEARGKRAMALYPLRRSNVPRHAAKRSSVYS